MNIKKYQNHEYINRGGVWVRNFCLDVINTPKSLSKMYEQKDFSEIALNEQFNILNPKIADEKIFFENILIVSDGFNFATRHLLIEKMPKNVCVIAVNGALKNWKLTNKRSINAYVVNNPYKECMNYMPHKNGYYPMCIASTRTHKNFIDSYKNDVYVYCPTIEKDFGLEHSENYFIDDYRNPICAAIGLAYQFKVKKLMLMCCDESFKDPRDYSIQLENQLWTYPHHLRSKQIIDANLYWLTHQKDAEVVVSDYSDIGYYDNATYIDEDQKALSFFTNMEESDEAK